MQRVFEESDSGNEKFAVSVVHSLAQLCIRLEGASVAVEAGVVEQATQALTGARGLDLRLQALTLLTTVATTSGTAQLAMREIIETAVGLVTSSFAVRRRPVLKVSSTPSREDVRKAEAAVKQSFRFHCFLSHDWGTDENGRDNHARVARVNDLLQDMGLKTWFDNENMQGDVKKAMAKGIAESAVVLCFLTDSYITKASGLGPEGEVS